MRDGSYHRPVTVTVTLNMQMFGRGERIFWEIVRKTGTGALLRQATGVSEIPMCGPGYVEMTEALENVIEETTRSLDWLHGQERLSTD